MSRVLYTRQAERDLGEIFDYLNQRSLNAARRFAKNLKKKTDLLARFPELGSRCEELAPGLRCFPIGSYVLFYRPIAAGIEVIRILYGSRDLPTIFRT